MTSALTPSAPRLPGVVRRWFATHPKLIDRIIAFTYVVASLIALFLDSMIFASEYEPRLYAVFLGIELVSVAGICWMLLLRRTRPLLGFAVAGFLSITFLPAHVDGVQAVGDAVALLYLIYAIAVFGSVKRAWIGYGIAGLITWVQLLVEERTKATASASFGSWTATFGGWVAVMVLYLIVVLIAINIGNRSRYIQALVERADYLERDREQLARISVAEERERIAREMHDIVAHSVSVMIALSEGSARTVKITPDKAINAMQRSAETGRTALSEMRRVLGVLKGEIDESAHGFAPQPGIDNLQGLIEDFREAGLEVRTKYQGTAPTDSGLGLAVFRIVQEALTNTLRYAGSGATVDLFIAHGADVTTISVRDYGRVTSESPTMDNLGSGNGLTGLAERARMFGGGLSAGPHPDGGWIVQANLQTNGTR